MEAILRVVFPSNPPYLNQCPNLLWAGKAGASVNSRIHPINPTAQLPVAMMVRFHRALAASHQALPSPCSRQDTPSSSARLNLSFDSEDGEMLSSSQFVDHIFFPFFTAEYDTFSPSRISIQPSTSLGPYRTRALLELQVSFVAKATRMPMRPWEETLFINSFNNYNLLRRVTRLPFSLHCQG